MAKIVKILELFPKPSKGGVRHSFIIYRTKYFFLLTTLITSLSGQFTTDPGSGKPTVAILDFEARGVSTQEVQTLSERMRTEIGNTNAVRLIERKAVDKIMEEQGFQQTGCTTDECASEVGQLLGVQYMISGAIGLMGKTYTIDAKMFSVETGETIRTKSATHKGDISGLLTEMEILAWEIVGLEAPGRLRLKRGGDLVKSTVAVLDFEGRGISVFEAQTLTDRFSTAMAGTGKVLMVERGTMMDVLEEQGFESGECTSDECAAEVGAMLGVEFMISGAIGKLGDTYTIDVKMFSVATGVAENMQNVTYQGKVDGLIVEIETLAWTILGLDSPKELEKKRKQFAGGVSSAEKKGGNWLLWAVLGVAAAGGGVYLMSAAASDATVAEIGSPPDLPTVP
ncbi:MAG: hypothetical protein IIB95_14405 [Candidatus Marinimicrobia bacterium]|nr:hypothetical protein [Candidatus Neomarinimicrobiota bacterium]